jgi:DNA-binding CsgD family transcriptional regulator
MNSKRNFFLPIHQTLSDEQHRDGQRVTVRPGADLVGRTAELELIDSLLAGEYRAGPGVLLRGDPGAGKSALLNAAAERATAVGRYVLRASGVECEAGVDFSALHQLLYPLRKRAGRLADHHRAVLDQILGLAPGSSPDPLAASTALLALLDDLAPDGPLLLIVDNVQWVDRASATALGFAVRRIHGTPTAFLAASRTGVDGFVHHIRLHERMIEPLSEQSAATVLDNRWPQLAPGVRRRLLAEAAGNPLALVELPTALTDRQRLGQDPLPALLPFSGRLEGTFAACVERLPAPTRKLLLLAALDADAGLTTLQTAAQGSADGEDLAPAWQANLVHDDTATGRLSFRHPLIRAAIVRAALPGERWAAHQAMAAALAGEPERRAWHLAEAATGPDEAVARALDEAALSAWRRNNPSGAADQASDEAAVSNRRRAGAAAAVTALMRAGGLSPHPADRSRRLVEAAYLATTTGQLDQVNRLLADAGQAPDSPSGLVFAATARLLAHQGDVNAAHQLLTQTFDHLADAAETNSWDHNGILSALGLVSLYALRPEPWELLHTAMARFEPEAVASFRLCYDAYVNPARTSDSIRERLADGFAALPTDTAPWQIMPLAYAAFAMDALSDYRYLVRRMMEQERDGGAIQMVISGLMLLSHDSYARGEWDEADNLAREGLELASAYGYHLLEGHLRAILAKGAALRGNMDLARTRSEETTAWAAPRGIAMSEWYAWSARRLAAMGQGDYEEAYVQASRVTPPGTPSSGVPGRWMVLDLVEAAVRTGRIDQARAHVAAAQQAGIHDISPRTALITAGAAALAANDDDAGALFEAALSLPEAARWPWEHARIQLAYGQWLRRTRSPRARPHLHSALETFDRIGAKAMAEWARNELRASGVGTVRPDTPTSTLTAQERQIAELAATGLSNKQIGERLFLSHRTVGSHLHRLFPKLGITSRAALRSALEAMAPDEHDQAAQPAFPTEGHDGQPSRSATHA